MILRATYLTKFFLAEKSQVVASLLFSFSFTGVIDVIAKHIEGEALDMSLLALSALCFVNGMIAFFDFITGVMVARKREEPLDSSKMGHTVGKYFGIILYGMVASVLILILSNNYFVLSLLFGPLILNIFKEFISIGENLNKRNGKKPYIFTVVDKVFDLIERRFFKKIEENIVSIDTEDFLKNKN